jgi:hypothetical protein
MCVCVCVCVYVCVCAQVDENRNELIEFDEFAVLVESCYELSAGLAAADERYPDPYPDPYTADGYTQTGASKTEYTWPGLVFTYVIKSVFDVLTFFFSYDQKGISTVQLEVLPLDKYVCGIQSDILQQAAFVAAQTPGKGLLRQVSPSPPPPPPFSLFSNTQPRPLDKTLRFRFFLPPPPFLSFQTQRADPWTRPAAPGYDTIWDNK